MGVASTIFRIYFIYSFALFFVLGIWIFSLSSEKAKRFPLCMLLIFLGQIGILSLRFIPWDNEVVERFFNSLIYLLCLFCAFLILRLVGKMPFRVSLFYAISAYVLQHFSYQLAQLWYTAGGMVFDNVIVSTVLNLATFILLYVFFFLFLPKNIQFRNEKLSKNKTVFTMAFITVFVYILLHSLSMNSPYFSDERDLYFNLYGAASSFAVLALLFSISRNNALETEKDNLAIIAKAQSEQYQLSKETIDLINIKCHDMRHFVRSFADAENHEEQEEIRKRIAIYDASAKTGSPAMDVVLMEQSLICEKNEIEFTHFIDPLGLSVLSEAETYSLFGNAISNAVRACSFLPKEKRAIHIVVKTVGNFASIRIENPYEGELSFANGLPQSDKGDDANHGFGLLSIRATVNKHGGTLLIDHNNGVFRLLITMPLNRQN